MNRSSEIPISKQLIEQIIVLIATGRFQLGDSLPSVRQLARQNGIHHNTVSKAYRELVRDGWLVRTAGRRLSVSSPDSWTEMPQDLDGLIDMTIRLARECGYTTKQLSGRLLERLANQPDHLLVVSTDPGIEEILAWELKSLVHCPVEMCSLDQLKSDSQLVTGALVICLLGGATFVRPYLPPRWPIVSISISDPEEALELISKMKEPSTVHLVSVSPLFLQRASGILAPALGTRHTSRDHLLERTSGTLLLADADLVLCDSVAFHRVKAPRAYEYRLIAPESLEEIWTFLPHLRP